MANPFEDENGTYTVLINVEGQYSLWPEYVDVPSGWSLVGPRGRRSECLEWIERTWTDMRPNSLIAQMQNAPAQIGLSDDVVA